MELTEARPRQVKAVAVAVAAQVVTVDFFGSLTLTLSPVGPELLTLAAGQVERVGLAA
jgi:hypothetical protein